MSEIANIIKNYKEIRERFRHPPNAVPDPGINLMKGRAISQVTTASDRKESPPPAHAEIVQAQPRTPPEPKPLTFQSTLQMTADAFNLTVGQMTSHNRKRYIVRPRQVAIYLATKYNYKSISWISEKLDIDHTTSLHAARRIAQLMDKDSSFKDVVKSIEHKITTLYSPPVAAHYQPHLGTGQEWHVSQPCLSEVD